MRSVMSAMDHTTLNWVHRDLEDTLSVARRALEEYADGGQRSAESLRTCSVALHSVHGVLEMLEYRGVSLFINEMELLCRGLSDRSLESPDDVCELLMQGVLQLSDYLAYLSAGHGDSPGILLPLLDDLRRVRGKAPLEENPWFSARVDAAIPYRHRRVKVEQAEFQQYMRRLRTHFQRGLLSWHQGKPDAEGTGVVEAVLRYLERLSGPAQLSRLWWTARGVIEAVREHGLESTAGLRRNFARLDPYIRVLAEQGPRGLGMKPPDDLVKGFLYQVARSRSGGPRVSAVRATFGLQGFGVGKTRSNGGSGDVVGPDLDALRVVAGAIKEELSSVKDTLDTYVRSSESANHWLGPVAEKLQRVADTLGLLDIGGSHRVILAQVQDIQQHLRGGTSPDQHQLMGMAANILTVDAALESIAEQRVDSGFDAEGTADISSVMELEERRLVTAVIREISAELAGIKHLVSAHVDNPAVSVDLDEAIPRHLRRVDGSLRLLSLGQAADLLRDWGEQARLILTSEAESKDAVDSLADAIVSLEYYLQAVVGLHPNDSALLDFARERIAELERLTKNIPGAQDLGASTATSEDTLNDFGDGVLRSESLPSASPQAKEPPVVGPPKLTPTRQPPVPSRKAGATLESAPSPSDARPVVSAEAPAAQTASARARSTWLPKDIDENILDIFYEEADEVVKVLDTAVARWAERPDDRETLITVRRSFHTLKGSGRLVGARDIGEFGWTVEHLLNQVIDGGYEANSAVTQFVVEAHRALPDLLEDFKAGALPRLDLDQFMQRAKSALLEDGESESADNGPTEVSSPPQKQVDNLAEKAVALADGENSWTPEPATISYTEGSELIGADADLDSVPEPDTRQVFLEEGTQILDFAETVLNNWRAVPDNVEWVNELRRELHTLKGGANLCNLQPMGDLAHSLESVLGMVADGQVTTTQALLDLVETTQDRLGEMLERYRTQQPVEPAHDLVSHMEGAVVASAAREVNRHEGSTIDELFGHDAEDDGTEPEYSPFTTAKIDAERAASKEDETGAGTEDDAQTEAPTGGGNEEDVDSQEVYSLASADEALSGLQARDIASRYRRHFWIALQALRARSISPNRAWGSK